MGALICDACKGKGQIHVGGYAPFGPVQQWKTCPVCGGSGAIPYVDKDDTLKKCPACQGEGVLDEERESFYSDGSLKPARVCPVCKGKGVAIMGGAWLSHYYLCLIRFDSALWELEYLNKELLYSYDKLDKSKSAGDAGSTRKWESKIRGLEHQLNFVRENYYKKAVEDLTEAAGKLAAEKQEKEDPFSDPLGDCFIADAVYGGVDDRKVEILVGFRDRVLSNYKMGEYFIEIYYAFSPQIAAWLKRHAIAKVFMRLLVIEPIYCIVRYAILPLIPHR